MIQLQKRSEAERTSQDREAAARRRRAERQMNLPESFRKRLAEYDEAEWAIHLRSTRERAGLVLP